MSILACVPNHHLLPLKQQNAPEHVVEHLKRLFNRAYKKIGEARDILIFLKILIKIGFKMPHGVMDIRPIGDSSFICRLRTEINILDFAAKPPCF